jgi:hypothetical protein
MEGYLDKVSRFHMDYLYSFANASLILRVVEYLHNIPKIPVKLITVIHANDGWILRIKMNRCLNEREHKNLQAFMTEVGIPFDPEIKLQLVFGDLSMGHSPIQVMRRYQVAIVSHGKPDREEIEEFRYQFVRGLGHCPESLA